MREPGVVMAAASTWVRSAVAAGVVAGDTLVHAPAAIAAGLALGPDHEAVSWLYRDFARVALLGCGASVRVRGEEQLDARRRYVLVSNHSSHLDAMAILVALRRHGVRFVAKEELGRIPLFGAALRATGNVFVTRHDTRGDVARLRDASRTSGRGASVLFFPEGTRSETGELGRFKKGAAAFALRSRLALVPMGVHGTHDILPRGLEVRRGGEVGVCIGKPIVTRGRRFDQRDALTEQLRVEVAALVDGARRLVRS